MKCLDDSEVLGLFRSNEGIERQLRAVTNQKHSLLYELWTICNAKAPVVMLLVHGSGYFDDVCNRNYALFDPFHESADLLTHPIGKGYSVWQNKGTVESRGWVTFVEVAMTQGEVEENHAGQRTDERDGK